MDLERERDSLSADLSGVQAELSKNVSDRKRLELEVLETEEALAAIRKGLTDAEDGLQKLREEASQHDRLLIKEENRLQAAEKTLMELDEKGT